MISKFSTEDGILWDRAIGRVVNNRGITSGWYGITESIEEDGYVAAGTMHFLESILSPLSTTKH